MSVATESKWPVKRMRFLFNRRFHACTPPCPLEEIGADLKRVEEEIVRLRREVAE